MSDNPAGWQPDPSGKHDHRYWDGSQWTDNVADAGVASTDPYEAASSAPTVVTPVADTTASYPTGTAPPPVPPPYVPPSPVTDGGGSGGSKRGLMIGGAILAAVAIIVIAILALGGDDDEPTDPLADESTETTDDDGGNKESTDESTDATDEDVFGDDFSGGNIEDAIADAYEEAFGISEEKAQCLAERISDVIEEGELDEQEAMSEIFSYLADCDISMEEINAN